MLVKKHLCAVVDYFPSRGSFLAIVKCKFMLVALNPMSSWFSISIASSSPVHQPESRDFFSRHGHLNVFVTKTKNNYYPVVRRELRSYGYSHSLLNIIKWGAKELPRVSQPHTRLCFGIFLSTRPVRHHFPDLMQAKRAAALVKRWREIWERYQTQKR